MQKEVCQYSVIYRLEFAIVYRGKWRSITGSHEYCFNAVVAIKQFKNLGKEFQEHILSEIQSTKHIRTHPNVCQIFGCCDKPLSVLTEFLENGNLYEYLRGPGSIPDILIHNIIIGICFGMRHLVI